MKYFIYLFLFTMQTYAGEKLADLTTQPLFDFEKMKTSGNAVLLGQFESAPGHIAVSKTGRVFLDPYYYDKDSIPKVAELTDFQNGEGKINPFPANLDLHKPIVRTHSIRIDSKDHLWVLDQGNRGKDIAKILAFDLTTKEQKDYSHYFEFSEEIVPRGSYLNDFVIDEARDKIYITDTSPPLKSSPALIVYDVKNKTARRILENHKSVSPSEFPMIADGVTFKVGIVAPKPGVNGIIFDTKNDILYYAAANSGDLYKINVSDLVNEKLTNQELENKILFQAKITMSDGMAIDPSGNLYFTDFQHSAITRLTPNGKLETVIKKYPELRWPASIYFAPDGWLYSTFYEPQKHPDYKGPYPVYKFKIF